MLSPGCDRRDQGNGTTPSCGRMRRMRPTLGLGSDPMADLDLRPERRDQLAAELRAELEALIPDSSTAVRGSLAAKTADPYSDIDLCWVVRDETFTAAVSA